jgi:phage shock protein A
MGIFSKIKNGISSKANAALDKAIDPEKELEMAILELEEGRRRRQQELVRQGHRKSSRPRWRSMGQATGVERRAMMAVRAGDDEAADCAQGEEARHSEYVKIERDKHELRDPAQRASKEFEIAAGLEAA